MAAGAIHHNKANRCWWGGHTYYSIVCMYMYSVYMFHANVNLRNFEIALLILEITKMCTDFEIA